MNDTGRTGQSGERAMLAFATCACCVSALALAFTLGRHWPVTAEPQRPIGTSSLREVQQRGATPLAEIQIDRGNQTDNMRPAQAVAATPDNTTPAANEAAVTGETQR